MDQFCRCGGADVTDPKRLAQRMIRAQEDPENNRMPEPPVLPENADAEAREAHERAAAEYDEAWRIYQAHHEPDEEERMRLTRERVDAENALAREAAGQ